MDVYTRYESGKTAKDYYHEYLIQIPNDMGNMLGAEANDRNKAISAIVRGYIVRGLERDGHDITPFISF